MFFTRPSILGRIVIYRRTGNGTQEDELRRLIALWDIKHMTNLLGRIWKLLKSIWRRCWTII